MAKKAKKSKKSKSMRAEDYPSLEEIILSLEEGFGVTLSDEDKAELAAQVKEICA